MIMAGCSHGYSASYRKDHITFLHNLSSHDKISNIEMLWGNYSKRILNIMEEYTVCDWIWEKPTSTHIYMNVIQFWNIEYNISILRRQGAACVLFSANQ